LVRISSGLLAMSLLAAGCGTTSTAGSPSNGGSPSGNATVALNGEKANDHGTKDVSGGGAQSVEVDNFYFNPTIFTGKAGDKLTLTLSNESKALHNFSVADQKIDQDVAIGGKVTATVTIPASGTAIFFCKYHRTKGMLGGLRVEAS
jgi:plastocyanin